MQRCNQTQSRWTWLGKKPCTAHCCTTFLLCSPLHGHKVHISARAIVSSSQKGVVHFHHVERLFLLEIAQPSNWSNPVKPKIEMNSLQIVIWDVLIMKNTTSRRVMPALHQSIVIDYLRFAKTLYIPGSIYGLIFSKCPCPPNAN